MKFATELIRHYSPHFGHVATLPWENKNSDVQQMWILDKMQTNFIFIASNFVSHPQFFVSLVFKITSFSRTVCK